MNEKMTIQETIKGLQSMIQSKQFIEHNFDGVVDEDVCERAIELLEEQETIVRCKNCIHWAPCEGSIICGTCKQGHLRSANWFCADGERNNE